MRDNKHPEPTPQPQFDDVLKRMLNSPPKQHTHKRDARVSKKKS